MVKIFPKRKRTVGILGCGPAGLFAAQAFDENEWQVSILSRKRKSDMFGAQYLHKPIPGLTFKSPRLLSYQLDGTLEGYAVKVYGGKVKPEAVSPASLVGEHHVWDIREAYDNAWDKFESRITDTTIERRQVIAALQGFDTVVSSIPLPPICLSPETHRFPFETIWAIGDAPERNQLCPVRVHPFTVECNGKENPSWYRASNIFGYCTAEWPEGDFKPPVEGIARVRKPLSNTCDCYKDSGLIRVGRFGTWTKGVLSHQAYEVARERARRRK